MNSTKNNMDNVTPTAQNTLTTVNLNTAGFIKAFADSLIADVESAYYSNGSMAEDEAHAALQRIKGRARVLQAFITNLS